MANKFMILCLATTLICLSQMTINANNNIIGQFSNQNIEYKFGAHKIDKRKYMLLLEIVVMLFTLIRKRIL